MQGHKISILRAIHPVFTNVSVNWKNMPCFPLFSHFNLVQLCCSWNGRWSQKKPFQILKSCETSCRYDRIYIYIYIFNMFIHRNPCIFMIYCWLSRAIRKNNICWMVMNYPNKLYFSARVMWETQCHKQSAFHRHFDGCYVCHPQSWQLFMATRVVHIASIELH